MRIFLSIVIFGMIAVLLSILYEYDRILSRDFSSREEKKASEKNNQKNALIFWTPSMHKSAETIKNIMLNTLIESGYNVTANYPTSDFTYKYDDFECICYISPVYFGKVSKAMCEKMVSSNYNKKKVMIVGVGKALTVKKELEYMKGLLDKNNDISMIKVSIEKEKMLVDFVKGAIV